MSGASRGNFLKLCPVLQPFPEIRDSECLFSVRETISQNRKHGGKHGADTGQTKPYEPEARENISVKRTQT